MVAQATTTPLPTLSRPDRLRLTLYFAGGQSTEALAFELLEIHRNHQSHLSNPTNPPANFLEAIITENTALDSSSSLTSSPVHPFTSSSQPPDAYDLAAWTLSDPIAPHIAYRRAESLERRKQSALHELDAILADSASSPIEKRRAATTMLRMLSSQLYRNRVSSSPSSPERGGGGGAAVLRGGGGSVCTPSTHSPSCHTPPISPLAPDSDSSSPHPRPSTSTAADLSSDLCPSVQSVASSSPDLGSSGLSVASSLCSSPPKPATIDCCHATGGFHSSSINAEARPHPDLTPQDLIALALVALKTPTDRPTRTTLEHFLTPQATINREPALNLESQLTPLAPKLKVVQIFGDERATHSPGPPESRTSESWFTQPGRSNGYQITLTRADSGPHPSCWLISDINTIKDTS